MRRYCLLKGWLLPLLLALAWTAVAAEQQQGTLVVALGTLGSQSMDPIQETRSPHAHYQAPVYDALVGFNFEKGGKGPGVAERWEHAKDGLSWIFHIRKGLKWHNGDPITAHDVKFSLERTSLQLSRAGPETPSPRRPTCPGMTPVSACDGGPRDPPNL